MLFQCQTAACYSCLLDIILSWREIAISHYLCMKHISIFRNHAHVPKILRDQTRENNLSLLSLKREWFHNLVLLWSVAVSPDGSSGFRLPVVTSVKPSLGLRVCRKWKGGGAWSCSQVSCRGQIVEEGVIEGRSLDADPDPPRGLGEGWRE